jgi:hypothetical protein
MWGMTSTFYGTESTYIRGGDIIFIVFPTTYQDNNDRFAMLNQAIELAKTIIKLQNQHDMNQPLSLVGVVDTTLQNDEWHAWSKSDKSEAEKLTDLPIMYCDVNSPFSINEYRRKLLDHGIKHSRYIEP